MSELKYTRGLEIISETAHGYEEKRELFRRKQTEKQGCEDEINVIKQEIDELSSKVLSVDDIKKDAFVVIEKTYTDEVALANREYKAKIDEIGVDEKKAPEVSASIKKEYDKKISAAHSKVDNAENEVKRNSSMIGTAENKVADLESQINNSELEENQIRLCANHIAHEYDNVANNAGFLGEYKGSRGATEEAVQKKFQSLSSEKTKKIAGKMNSGAYVSAPDETKGFPIGEILVMAATTILLAIKGIGRGVGFLYRPISGFRKATHKIIYAVVVTLVLFWIVSFVSNKFGTGIGIILLAVLIFAIAAFLGMVLFNIIKYSNKAFRKEQNLEYYTVGYFFTNDKEAILYKIACDYYAELKTKNPTELDTIIETSFGTLKNQKEIVNQELSNCKKQLETSRLKLTSAEEQFTEEKSILEKQCKEEIDSTIKSLHEECERRRNTAKDELEKSLALSVQRKEDATNNVETKAIETLEKQKHDIEKAKQRLSESKDRLQVVVKELDTICTEADKLLRENNDMASTYKKLDIDGVDKREKGDKLPEELVIGLTETKKSNLKTGKEDIIYKLKGLRHERKPIILVCNANDDESINVTERFYSFVDSLVADTFAKMYMGGFRYVLVDSQGNKPGIMKNMETCGSSFEVLEKVGCIKVCTDSSNKCFEDIIHEQEKALNGKNIDDFNEEHKNLDNMVRHTFLCIRVYSKKRGDFSLGDFRKRIDSSLNNGIIPIILMGQNYFEEKKADLENTIKELCGNRYYILDVNQGGIEKINI